MRDPKTEESVLRDVQNQYQSQSCSTERPTGTDELTSGQWLTTFAVSNCIVLFQPLPLHLFDPFDIQCNGGSTLRVAVVEWWVTTPTTSVTRSMMIMMMLADSFRAGRRRKSRTFCKNTRRLRFRRGSILPSICHYDSIAANQTRTRQEITICQESFPHQHCSIHRQRQRQRCILHPSSCETNHYTMSV